MGKWIGVAIGVVATAIGAGIGWVCGKKKGHAVGVKDGYVKASKVYEQKLLRQAEQFLRERNRMSTNAAEKDKIIQALVGLLKQTQDVNRRERIQKTLSLVRAA